jgi:hypothetical protein
LDNELTAPDVHCPERQSKNAYCKGQKLAPSGYNGFKFGDERKTNTPKMKTMANNLIVFFIAIPFLLSVSF